MNGTVKLAIIGAAVALGTTKVTGFIKPHTASVLGANNDLVVDVGAAVGIAILLGKVL